MHKKRLTSSILVITLIASLLCGCGKEKDKKEEFTPTPLIIEETSNVQTGIYKGCIAIMDENTADTQYEGAMYIYIKDDTAIIMTNDYIRNKYDAGEGE